MIAIEAKEVIQSMYKGEPTVLQIKALKMAYIALDKQIATVPNNVKSVKFTGSIREHLPAAELIKRYDTPDVFIYADPPYLHGTRKNYLYKKEMLDKQHEELLEVLVKHQGKVLLSGYENDLYSEVLSGWKKVKKETRAEGGRKRIETLWMNYDIEQVQILLSI